MCIGPEEFYHIRFFCNLSFFPILILVLSFYQKGRGLFPRLGWCVRYSEDEYKENLDVDTEEPQIN